MTMQFRNGLYEKKQFFQNTCNLLFSFLTKTDYAVLSCHSIVFFWQSYDEELGATAQAWVDRCILAHGPPSTRMINGIILLYFSLPTRSTQSDMIKKQKQNATVRKKLMTVFRLRVTWPPCGWFLSSNSTFIFRLDFCLLFWECGPISFKKHNQMAF